jgi:pimeloyl-ACP methyl ester carboxylesterase
MAGLLALAAMCGTAEAAVPVSGLKATARDGQVFLTWQEAETPIGTTFNVYLSSEPIASVAHAERVGHHIERHSARDWWTDPTSFDQKKAPGKPVGFLIQSGGQRLDPAGGLFVHTVGKNAPAKLYFAVTSMAPSGKEDTLVATGVNSLRHGTNAPAGEIRPIWQRGGKPIPPGAGKGKSLRLELHGKSWVVPDMEYLFFGDASMGWREGLAVKFSVRVEGQVVVIRPTDRVWIGRPHNEADDGGMPAIWTGWYGYNSKIYDRQLMGEGVPTNYTQRRNLWILQWVREYYQVDPAQWSCCGSSMGGCGTISFGLHHPELFAALHAHVPIVAYTYLGSSNTSAHRLEPSCWIGPIAPDLKTDEGVSLLDRLNGTKFVRETPDDLPPLFLINGRQDASIPWVNNPPFYRALDDARQGFAVYWDNGTHPTCGKDAPADVKAWAQRIRRFRLDESFPAFSNTSTNRNPGNGQPDDGDLIGWMNRGMDWKEIEDSPARYAITIIADYPGIEYPARSDVTLRRVQRFKTRPGERLTVRVGDSQPAVIEADAHGRITIPKVVIPSSAGVRIVVGRGANVP